MKQPKLYIDDFVGVTNRLEALPVAFAIQKKFGHEIILDWPELKDALVIEGTEKGKVWLNARLGAKRLRDCSLEDFESLSGQKVILRSLEGPEEYVAPIYMDVAARIKLKPLIAEKILEVFNKIGDSPVVGVHIRHGDFKVQSEEVYNPKAWDWPAVPIWWYQKVMRMICNKVPEVKFFLSSTGDPLEYKVLFDEFNVFTLTHESNYYKRRDGNQSKMHPVADLFSLACCKTVLATPLSGYSHWAANVLGVKADVIIPKSGATKSDPKPCLIDTHGRRLSVWRKWGRESINVKELKGNLNGVIISRPELQWLFV